MPQLNYLVTGASRGVGKGIVEQLSQVSTNHVYATTRKATDFGKSNITNVVLELTDSKSIEAAAVEIKKLDVLIVNAAIGDLELLVSTSLERFQEYLDTNVLGVHRMVNAFLPALRAGTSKKIVIISSTSGSLTIQKGSLRGFQGPYATTKAANNMQAMQYHNELYREGFIVLSINPGWVATDMGNVVEANNDMKPISIKESAAGVVKVVDGLKKGDSGTFLSYNGTAMPW